MSDWDVELEFKDGGSAKFWRAKVTDTTLTTNWGKIGAKGQSKVKEHPTSDAAVADRDKQAGSKRKKGYLDAVSGAAPKKAEPIKLEETWEATLELKEEGRKVALEIACDGSVITTRVVETYTSDESAAAAFKRVREQLKSEGYS